MDKYIKKILIEEISHLNDLDIVLQDDFGFDYESGDFIIDEISDGSFETGYPVKIDDLIKELKYLKSEGSNYVSLGYDEQHYSYDLSGWNIRKMTVQEQLDYKVEQQKMNHYIREGKIKNLQQELDSLKEFNKAIDKY